MHVAYHHYSCEFKPRSWRGVLDATLCDKVCHSLATDRVLRFPPPIKQTADIITIAISYNRQSELDKYRQLSGMTDILITLVVFYNQNSLSISSAVWYGRHNNYPSYALLPTF
jgi:hypothetical protein